MTRLGARFAVGLGLRFLRSRYWPIEEDYWSRAVSQFPVNGVYSYRSRPSALLAVIHRRLLTCGGCQCYVEQDGSAMELLTLYRPVGPKELALVEASGFRKFPPRLPDQPIFYPVTNEEYATQIARDWNVRHDGAGFVTRFQINAQYPEQKVGGSIHTELWVPADDLTRFNENIVGLIEVIAEFR